MNYEELEKLNDLKEKGIITEQEFQREKDKIFGIRKDNGPLPQNTCEASNVIKPTNTSQKKKFDDYNGYRTWTGIVILVLGLCLMVNYGNDIYGDSMIVFFLPGLLGFIAGVMKLVSKKSKTLLIIAGICSIISAIINAIGILNISLFGAFALIVGFFDFNYVSKMNKTE